MSEANAEINVSIRRDYQFKDIFEAWQVTFVEVLGIVTKGGLAESIGILPSSWSDKFDRPTNSFYEEQRRMLILMRETNNYLPLHTMAAACGFELVRKLPPEPDGPEVRSPLPAIRGNVSYPK